MSKNYDKKVVFDYICGNDIVDYDIDDLENDYQFMIDVIKYTRDKNMYNLCSTSVKNNYIFVKFLVQEFKNDLEFISMVADNYLSSLDKKDITFYELNILMCDIIGENCDTKYASYHIQKSLFYTSQMLAFSSFIKQEEDETVLAEFGLGFPFIIDEYGTSDVIQNFFARNLINEIFYNDNMTLEELIHKQLKDYKKIEVQGINQYLIYYISSFDSYLASYASVHPELLKNISKEVNNIITNWENYLDRINKRKISIFYQEVEKELEKLQYGVRFSLTELINYVVKKLNLESIFEKYDDSYKMTLDLLNAPFDDEELKLLFGEVEEESKENLRYELDFGFSIDESKMNIQELRCLNCVMEIANELFNKDVIEQKEPNYDLKRKKGQILKVDFGVKKVK